MEKCAAAVLLEGKIQGRTPSGICKKNRRKRKGIFFNRNSFFNDILIVNKRKIYNFDSIIITAK